MKLTKIAPWVAFGVALVAVAVAVVPPRPVNGFDVGGFGHLPVLEGGRVKPIDSVARNDLLMIRGQTSFRFDADGETGPEPARTVGPDEWMLDVLFRPDRADRQPIFVINDPDVLGLMALRQSADRYYAFETLAPHVGEIRQQAIKASEKEDEKQRSRYENAVLNLWKRLSRYQELKNTVQLQVGPSLAEELAQPAAQGAGNRHALLDDAAVFRILPPVAGESRDGWHTSGQGLTAAAGGAVDPALVPWARLSTAWAKGDADAFNGAVGALRQLETARAVEAVRQGDHEIVFNRVDPFYAGMVIYVLALLAVFVSWVWKPDVMRPLAFGLLAAGALVHTAGLVSRILLQGRPPVTNLYSSAVFVGWAAVVLGVVLERVYRSGLGTAVAGAAGFSSLIVAYHLMGDGDTMEMMRAVLDSNFWLGTHVVTITIGYSGTFVAGIVAIGWTIWKHVTGGTDLAAHAQDPSGASLAAAQGTNKQLVSAAYGIICFALLFSFVGTVLGGIWADQSWGRFWGWDPKENGALLIVLWNAIILHARWGGFVRDRGIMGMAIFGNVITSLSWFGVNMLGVGLHSYGFMDKALWALSGFIGSQLVAMAFAFAPPRFWRAWTSSRAAEPAGGPARG